MIDLALELLRVVIVLSLIAYLAHKRMLALVVPLLLLALVLLWGWP